MPFSNKEESAHGNLGGPARVVNVTAVVYGQDRFDMRSTLMKASTRLALVSAVLVVVVPVGTQAHFKLMEPASWIIEDDRGDPQKSGPCGGSNTDYGKPSYIVSQAVGGSKLHLKVQETIYHPGHYRVALAVNSPAELPVDPKATTTDSDRGPRSVSAEIQNPVQLPVLADGLFVHTAKVETPF